MNKEQLQVIKERCEGATSGPWYRCEHTGWIMAVDPYGIGHNMHVADIRGWGDLTGKGHGACGLSDEAAIAIQDANTYFIVYARQDIPALLEYIAELEAQIKT